MAQLNDLTIAEVETIEEYSGQTIDAIGAQFESWTTGKGRPSIKVLRAFAFVLLRRGNPQLTMEQAGDVKMTDLVALISDDGEAPSRPTRDTAGSG